MSVAVAYAVVFPTWAAAVFILATVVGFSRVRLGVHYPSDVLVGQVIAIATSAAMAALL
jgi:undecaprenyl-diphosphatase